MNKTFLNVSILLQYMSLTISWTIDTIYFIFYILLKEIIKYNNIVINTLKWNMFHLLLIH